MVGGNRIRVLPEQSIRLCSLLRVSNANLKVKLPSVGTGTNQKASEMAPPIQP